MLVIQKGVHGTVNVVSIDTFAPVAKYSFLSLPFKIKIDRPVYKYVTTGRC